MAVAVSIVPAGTHVSLPPHLFLQGVQAPHHLVRPFPCHYVETTEEASAFLRWLGERRPLLSVDTETSGLFPYGGDVLRLVQFGDGEAGWALDVEMWKGVIAEALHQYTGPVAMWNANFDQAYLEQAGLPVVPLHRLHDGMVMDHLLDPARSHALKRVGDSLFPGSSAAQSALDDAFRLGGWNWATIPTNNTAYWTYACADVVTTTRILEVRWAEIHQRGLLSQYQREMAVQDIACRMERKGLRIDPYYTDNLRLEWTAEMHALEEDLQALGVANPSAGQQVAQALQLTENWEPDDWTETGLVKLDEKILKGIDSDIARKVLRYRRLRKWVGTYLDTFLARRDANDRLHANIKTLRAQTGRMSITGPPLQTLPRGPEIRNCVIPSEGNALLAVDYDGVEARLFAHFSNDEKLISAFKDGLDVHTYTASQAYQIPMSAVTKDQRQVAKNVTFAKLYGAGAAKIADTANITEAEAVDFLDRYDVAFPGVPAFMQTVDTLGRQRLAETGRPYVTTWGGRYAPADPEKVFRLVNYLIQGSAADALKHALIGLDGAGLGEYLLLPVHDEVLFDVPVAEFEAVRREAQSVMEYPTEFAVPLTTHASEPQARWGSE